MQTNNSKWRSTINAQLVYVLTKITDKATMQKLLDDLMTEKEIAELAARLEATRMLQEGKKYSEIIAKTKLSSRTIARASAWLQNGTGGYAVALKILKKAGRQDQPSSSNAE